MSNLESRKPEVEDEGLDDAVAARGQKMVLMGAAAFIVLTVGVLLWIYREKPKDEEKRVHAAEAPVAPRRGEVVAPSLPFHEAAAASGIDFVHTSGAKGRRLLPETMGSGAAFIDFDRDGDPDLVLANGADWDESARANGPTQAFYRNDGGRFTDVTKEVGLDACFYAMGVSVGDYDGDGFDDLYFTAVGPNRLYKNVDGKRFEDRSQAAGVSGGAQWSTASVFFDGDGDGDLDLFVANYITWSVELDLRQSFSLGSLDRAYGPPTGFQGAQPFYFVNQGDGRFVEDAAGAGLAVKNRATGVPAGKSLAVIATDLEGDGRTDLLVANDTVQNFAFRNLGGGRFAEVGSEIGVAFDDKGNARGAMGITCSRFRNDLQTAVAIGNFANEMSAFFVAADDKDPLFIDEAPAVGIGAATRDRLTFGMTFADLDLDGFEDLIAANGHVEPEISRVQASQSHAQPLDLFWNEGRQRRGRFQRLGVEQCGAGVFEPMVGRGLAVADVDGDGDLDFLVTANGGRPRLFINEKPAGRSLRLDLRLPGGRRTAVGAVVELSTQAGRQMRRVAPGGSYLSASETTLTFGLGDETEARSLKIRWPDGRTQEIDRLAAGRHEIVQASN